MEHCDTCGQRIAATRKPYPQTFTCGRCRADLTRAILAKLEALLGGTS